MSECRIRWRTLTIPIEEELLAAIEQAARADDRPKGAQVRFLLKTALSERGFWAAPGTGRPPALRRGEPDER
jgi:hypothetical protein